MNILALSEVIYPHGSGAELATYRWAKILACSGYNVRVVTNRFPGEPEKSQDGNLQIIRMRMFGTRASQKYSTLMRSDLMISSPFRKLLAWADVVYVPRFWYSAIPMAKAYRKPVITHLHDYVVICSLSINYDLLKQKTCDSRFCRAACIVNYERTYGRTFPETVASSFLNFSLWRYLRRLVELSDAVICVSESHRKLVIRRMSSLTGKSHVVYNLVTEGPPMPLGGSDLGYFGGPGPLKGFDRLSSALHLARSKPSIHLTGFSAATSNVGQCNMAFHKRLPEEDFRRLYGHIGTVLVPSVWPETFGYVVAEALLNCRLLIASDVGAIPELVGGCPGAFLYESSDCRRLAELIDSVCSLDKTTVAELGAKNRETFLAKFNNKKSYRDFASIIDRTLAS